MKTFAGDNIRLHKSALRDCPFVRSNGMVWLQDPKGKPIEFGHRFDRRHGYRVYFRYVGVDAVNTWMADNLIEWLEDPTNHNEHVARIAQPALAAAKHVAELQAIWEGQRKPKDRVSYTLLGSVA